MPLPRWVDIILLPVLNVTLAFIIGGIVVLIVGENPIEAVRIMIYGAFGYGYGFGFTLYYTTNFIAGCSISAAKGKPMLAGSAPFLWRLPLAGCTGPSPCRSS